VVSGGFLYLIAAMNLVVLVGIAKVVRDMRRGTYDECELEGQLLSRGVMYRFVGCFMRSIDHAWQMFFVGAAFGIGFDTATEVLLLGATTAAATQGLPVYAVLALPILFSAGMCLMDTIDGCCMSLAYGWAVARPVRKLFYNIVVTVLSIVVAFGIGTVEIGGLLASKLRWHGWLGDYLARFDINSAGLLVAGLFIVVWGVALCIWHFGSIDARWDARASHD